LSTQAISLSDTTEPVGDRFVGRIPVRNLWLLMLYASNQLRHLGVAGVDLEENPEKIPDLVAELLAEAVNHRIRRNLSFGYQPKFEVRSRVRGRIDHLYTSRHRLMSKGKIACDFEELTVDTPRNRLVCAALRTASRIVSDSALAKRCASTANRLIVMGVGVENMSRSYLQSVQFGRNDSGDQQMVELARLMFNLKLPTEEAGPEHIFAPDREETWVRKLYEKALLGFFDLKLSNAGWRVAGSKQLQWQMEHASDRILNVFPGMEADIVLDHATRSQRIIIDTKFTSILTRNRWGDERFKSGHIYQIYTYLRSQVGGNDPLAEFATGILLYPSIGESFDESAVIQNHKIKFTTVDLTLDPVSIRERLLEVV